VRRRRRQGLLPLPFLTGRPYRSSAGGRRTGPNPLRPARAAGFCAPPTLILGLSHAPPRRDSATARVALEARYWVDNRSGLDLVLLDVDRSVLAVPRASLLGARPPPPPRPSGPAPAPGAARRGAGRGARPARALLGRPARAREEQRARSHQGAGKRASRQTAGRHGALARAPAPRPLPPTDLSVVGRARARPAARQRVPGGRRGRRRGGAARRRRLGLGRGRLGRGRGAAHQRRGRCIRRCRRNAVAAAGGARAASRQMGTHARSRATLFIHVDMNVHVRVTYTPA
jgi:hypothetical protein